MNKPTGRQVMVLDTGCATGEVQFGCGSPNTINVGHIEKLPLRQIYGADAQHYYAVEGGGRVGFAKLCGYNGSCSALEKRIQIYRSGGSIYGYQGGYFGSIAGQILRPNDAPFGNEFLCGPLTPEGRFQDGCAEYDYNVYRLVSEAEELSEITALSVKGCGIEIVVDETGINLNGYGAEEFSPGPYKKIQIVRDVSVLALVFTLEETEMTYASMVSRYEGECQFEVALPAGFSPFVADVFGHLPVQV
eukprot:Trichotokara_eunicae@DN6353_c3_g4_i2.p1